ncbi:MAG: helix-turn-helix domain-containing protein [Candidatus Hodarchaeales archaeon]
MIIISFNLGQPNIILEKIGLENILSEVTSVVMLNAYQYDQGNFFSLQKITFSDALPKKTITRLLRVNFDASFVTILNQTGNIVTCVMKQTRSTGFFPFLKPGYWGFLFPISVTKDKINIRILVQKNSVSTLIDSVKTLGVPYSIVGIRDIDMRNLENADTLLVRPKLTQRQLEILKFAEKKGFYESPRHISAQEISKHFGISITAVNKHLRDAEAKTVRFYFGS